MASSENPGTSSVPPLGRVSFGDFRRTTPLVRAFGFSRGQPIDRHYIESFLRENTGVITGRVLEVGGSDYTAAFGKDVVRTDVLHVSRGNPQATIVADLASAPHIPSSLFDCIICTQTLQLIYDLQGAVRTLHRILKPGGVLLATFPGISQTDDPGWADTWYWSLTPVAARRLFGDVFGEKMVEARSHGNVLTAMCFLHGLAAEELRPEEFAHHDAAYPFLVTVAATKRAGKTSASWRGLKTLFRG